MKKNMGASDRVIRIIAAVIIAGLYSTGAITGTIGTILIAFAGILVLTSLAGRCPLYLPFGISTRKKKSPSETL